MIEAERQIATLHAREPTVRAFVCHDAERALRQTRMATGPLAGSLIGVKDIIATADFPTRYGTTRDTGPREDAWCVARLKQLGAAILGKTVCTAFAYPQPGPTTNPHDPARSPGGSSSGSAAAVAAGFVSFALGTQTAGSTIRPASYCGITGFKPSYGLVPLDGVQPIASTLDHVGVFARSPCDAWYLTSAMVLSQPEALIARKPARLLLLRVPPPCDYAERLARLAEMLRRNEIEVDALDLPMPVEDFSTLQKELCYWEAARILLVPGRVQPVPELQALLAPYLDQDIAEYAVIARRRHDCFSRFDALASGYDAVVVPAATGAAPPIADTGDAIMSRFWTALHIPAVTVPLWRDGHGMPLGLQLLARLGEDRSLMEVAQWMMEKFALFSSGIVPSIGG